MCRLTCVSKAWLEHSICCKGFRDGGTQQQLAAALTMALSGKWLTGNSPVSLETRLLGLFVFRVYGQRNRELRSLARLTFNRDASLVFLDDVIADG